MSQNNNMILINAIILKAETPPEDETEEEWSLCNLYVFALKAQSSGVSYSGDCIICHNNSEHSFNDCPTLKDNE